MTAALLTACTTGGPPQMAAGDAETLTVTVSIPPQKYFVERVGGKYVRVNVMVGRGSNPATYEPRPDQLAALSESAAYVTYGAPFEKAWMNRMKSTNPDILVVDTTQGIDLMPIAAHTHTAEEEHEATTENLDPHIFVSPNLVKVQAANIYQALAALDAAHQPQYKTNLDRFLEEIDSLDNEIRHTLADLDNRQFMVFHPSWGYFARDYDLEMVPIEVGGQEPSPAELAALVRQAQQDGIKVVFAQPEFSTEDAQTIAHEIGGEVLLVSPLAEDWADNLRTVAATFAEVLSRP
jgi:zinc transport system substrate-binding protein